MAYCKYHFHLYFVQVFCICLKLVLLRRYTQAIIFKKYYYNLLLLFSTLRSSFRQVFAHCLPLHCCIFSFFHFFIVIYIDNAIKIPSGKCSHTACLYIGVVCVYASAFCRRKIIFLRTSVAREKETGRLFRPTVLFCCGNAWLPSNLSWTRSRKGA